jgi:hypothetical protein
MSASVQVIVWAMGNSVGLVGVKVRQQGNKKPLTIWIIRGFHGLVDGARRKPEL